MKNIEQILQEMGVELTDDRKKTLNKEVNENYKTINDYNTQKQKAETAEQSAKDNEKALSNFKKQLEELDVKDIDGVKTKLTDLETSLSTQRQQYENQIKKLNFEPLLKSKAEEFGCVDFDLARGQLDIEKLLESTDQSKDIEKAFNDLKEAKPILFKATEPEPKGKGGIIGSLGGKEEDKKHEFKNFF